MSSSRSNFRDSNVNTDGREQPRRMISKMIEAINNDAWILTRGLAKHAKATFFGAVKVCRTQNIGNKDLVPDRRGQSSPELSQSDFGRLRSEP